MTIVCFLMYFFTLVCQYMQLLRTTEAHTLNLSQSICDGQSLISHGGKFELGFFSPTTTSKNRYLGIWYSRIPTQTVVWVANRDSPLLDTSGVLKISITTGKLVIVDQTESVVWSSSSSQTVESPIVEFLESGNLVLKDDESNNYLWQSFDYPCDTYLAGMKFGQNFKTGMLHYLSSWKKYDDPSYGDFTLEVTKYSEPIIRNGPKIYFRGGLWDGVKNSGIPDCNLKENPIFRVELVSNEEEMYYVYQQINQFIR